MNHLTESEQAMRARCDAATKGPWEKWDGCSWRRIGSIATDKPVLLPIKAYPDGHPDIEATDADLEFVAQARHDLPACLDTIEKLRAELAEARKTLERAYWLVEHFETATYDSKADWCRLARAFLAKHKESNDGNK